MLVHASSVLCGKKAVLLAGPPGVGKSDVALRLIDGGGMLVSDDQTLLFREGPTLWAAPPSSIKGLIEIRHVGLFQLPFCEKAPVALYVDLVPPTISLERLPDNETTSFLGIVLPKITLPSFEASTPAKIRASLSFIRKT
ncbi:MAG: HPr kinase/phosphatase C-terminal domain-containing protein [Alphaproteobacteria bacterium]|nr:HPr kinase/phosphatase C-terminal domain-containing protein [Alphaproteobacteria bacterium]